MYFHPFMFNADQTARFFIAYHELMHRRMHADVVEDPFRAQMDNIRTLSEATDFMLFAMRVFPCAVHGSLKPIEVSMQSRKIAANTQGHVIDLLGRHAQERARPAFDVRAVSRDGQMGTENDRPGQRPRKQFA